MKAIIVSLQAITLLKVNGWMGGAPVLSKKRSSESSLNIIQQEEIISSLCSSSSSSSSTTPCLKTSDVLSLESIRSSLIRQEETIVFALIERSQYRNNPIVYEKGGLGDLGTPVGSSNPNDVEQESLSFLEYMLIGTEALHYGVRRYTSPEEHAFFPERLPECDTLLTKLTYPSLLDETFSKDSCNFNSVLLERYIRNILPLLTDEGDDEQHGSSVILDISVLQALSRRIHYGKFVAESKYRSNPSEYQTLVANNDVDGVMDLLTNEAVEQKVLRRAKLKAATYGKEPTIDETQANSEQKVDPVLIESVYRDVIIPLTKIVEVAYLFRRCGKEPPFHYRPQSVPDSWLLIQT